MALSSFDGLMDEMGGTGSARARRCVMECAGRSQNTITYLVIEVALVSLREPREEYFVFDERAGRVHEQRPDERYPFQT